MTDICQQRWNMRICKLSPKTSSRRALNIESLRHQRALPSHNSSHTDTLSGRLPLRGTCLALVATDVKQKILAANRTAAVTYGCVGFRNEADNSNEPNEIRITPRPCKWSASRPQMA